MEGPRALHAGTEFANLETLKMACKHYAINTHFEFLTIKSDTKRYTIKCNVPECPWNLHASAVENTQRFSIRTIEEPHTCFGLMKTTHKQVTSVFIATRILDKLKQNPAYAPAQIKIDLKTELGVEVTYSMAWRGKELATKLINGTHEESYSLLPKYCEDLVNSNPDTTAILEKDQNNKFLRIFISYGATAKGFAHCLPILGLDGTHLKSKYLGILLAATGVDALGSLYPLAFAVVNAENDDNWLWFLSVLRKHVLEPHALATLEHEGLVLLSDRQKGLIDGVAAVFPGVPHGYCLRHRPATEPSKPRITLSRSRLGLSRARLGSFSVIKSFLGLGSAWPRS